MKIITIILCWILAAYCIYFPYSYFLKEPDKKEIKVSHILVNTKEEALNIKKEIEENNKSFEEMAEKYSTCSSREQKGNIGYTTRERILPEVEKVVFNIEKNIVSEPVKSSEGWHLIKIYDIKYFSQKDNEYLNS